MPKDKSLRRRPSTPNLKFPHDAPAARHTAAAGAAADPTSPPETPTASPPLSRKISLKPRHQPPFFDYVQSLARDPAIQPTGDGHRFSYRPGLGPEQLSPRSSQPSSESSEEDLQESADDEESERGSPGSPGSLPDASSDPDTSEGEEDDEDDDMEDDSGDDESDNSESIPQQRQAQPKVHITATKTATTTATTTTTVDYDFTIEDMDPMDSGCEGLDVLLPTEIESNRSRSRSRHKDLPKGMMQDLRNLNCSAEASSSSAAGSPPPADAEPELEFDEATFLQRRAELKRIRRVSMSSSFGKRTHSELSDDSDDGGCCGDVNDVGASARRMRKRLHRGSLLFQDPPAPRIDELDEPDSSEPDDVLGAETELARELPYWTMEIMEADSS